MLEVVVFIGLQGAGKSTFREQRFGASHALISKDRFRNNNPQLGQAVTATRRRVKVDRELPLGDEYAAFIAGLLRPVASPA
jgi:predicted kinase